jgi:hypothetical protein
VRPAHAVSVRAGSAKPLSSSGKALPAKRL